MKKNRLLATILCMCLFLGTVTLPVQAAPKGGFVATEEGTKWQNSDGTWAVNTWIEANGHKYHTGENGVLQTGLIKIDEQIYYFYNTGEAATGWTTLGADCYYFDANGVLAQNTVVNGCTVGSNGKLQKTLDEEGKAKQSDVVAGVLASIITPGMKEEDKLLACYNYVINASGYKRTYETPTADWTGQFAWEILSTGEGNCFRYAAAYASLAKGLGYDARVATGYIGNRKGGFSPHGWTEVRIGDTWYIFDTEMHDAKNGKKNYYFKTYETYPSKPLKKEADWPVYF